MLTMYPACFYPEANGSFTVIFPDLNYLTTQGKDLPEAISMAVDCLAGYLYEDMKLGRFIPSPSNISDIDPLKVAQELDENDNAAGAFTNIVSVDVAAYAKEHFEKSVKKTLSIPAWLNKAAIEANINFSQALQEVLISKLQL